MITALFVGIVMAQASNQAQPSVSASSLVSKMIAYYANAKSLVGNIKMTQAIPGQSVTIDTVVAFESPSKFYLKQVLNSKYPKSWLVTSDGKVFTYDYPNSRRWAEGAPEGRLLEAVAPAADTRLDFRQIFRAATLSLGDDSVPLDLAIGDSNSLVGVRDQIASIQYNGQQKLGSETVNVVSGGWREYRTAPTSGSFQMLITEDGQLRQYSRKEILAVTVPTGQSLPPQEITTVWSANLVVNGKPDEALFSVVR